MAERTRTLRLDTSRHCVGVVMEVTGGLVYLRPMGGGKEWCARPDRLEPVTEDEALSLRVAEANAQSRGAL